MFIPRRGVATDTLQNGIASNTIGSNTSRLFALFNDTRFTYRRTLNHEHSINANLGARFKQDRYESDYGVTYNSSTDDYRSLNSGSASLRDIGGNLSNMRWLNTYANIDYSYLNKYSVSLNLAIDGSSSLRQSAQTRRYLCSSRW